MAKKPPKPETHNQFANCFVSHLFYGQRNTTQYICVYKKNISILIARQGILVYVSALFGVFGDQFIPIGSGIVQFQEVKLCCSAL